MYHNKKAQYIDLFFTFTQASFKMAPNLVIIQESESSFFHSESKTIFKEIPRGISMEEINQLYQFFQIVSLLSLSELIGAKLDSPLLFSIEIQITSSSLFNWIIIGFLCLIVVVFVGYFVKERFYKKKTNPYQNSNMKQFLLSKNVIF